MKVFKFKHLFSGKEETHSETGMPSWITHREFNWFLYRHVLTLSVGQSVRTDFHKITRIE